MGNMQNRGYSKNYNKMGMVFQHFHLFPHLTVKENLELAPKLVKKEGRM